MTSEVEICNRALQMISGGRITSLTQATPAARECNVAYEPLRDSLLREYPWSFAIERTTLAPLSEEPEFNFSYQFQLPSDFLRLHPDYEHRPETDWTIEGDKLLTNDGDTLYFRYIKRVTDPAAFDPLFAEALSALIALEIAEPLTESNVKAERAERRFRDKIAMARQVNAIEKVSQKPPDDEWITARL